jgi:phosphate/sulfate permease
VYALVLMVPLVVLSVVLLILGLLARSARTVRVAKPHTDAAERASAHVRRRNRVAAIVGIYAGVAVFVSGAVVLPDWTAIVYLAPLTGAAVSLLAFALVPSAEFLENDAVRVADLVQRRPRDFARVEVPYILGGLLIASAAFVALFADRDGYSITYSAATSSTSASPYPGWAIAIPVIIAALGVLLLLHVSLRRVARASRPSDDSLRAADEIVRRNALRIITRLATGAFSATLGFVLLTAGQLLAVTFGGTEADEPFDAVAPYTPFVVLGWVELIVGAIALIFGAVVGVMGMRAGLARPYAIGAEPASEVSVA